MKLSELAAKPQLQEIIIDDKDIVEKYGDSLSFHVQDRLPLDTYVKLASLDQKNPTDLFNLMKDFILDENGIPVMNDGNVLPIDVLNAAVMKVTDKLGK
jgi:hypothetical protein